MQTDHSKAIRGLSIATIAVAGLCVLACVIGFIALGMGGVALSSITPDIIDYYEYDGYGYDYWDGEDTIVFAGLMLAFGGVFIFFELVASAVALVAGIFGLRFFDKREKMNLLFGWSLAGAIASFLGGSIVTMVLLIIVCVFSYKDKQLATVRPVTVTTATSVPAYTAPTSPAASIAPAVQPATIQPAQPAVAQPTTAQPAQQPAPVEQAVAQPATPEEPKAE